MWVQNHAEQNVRSGLGMVPNVPGCYGIRSRVWEVSVSATELLIISFMILVPTVSVLKLDHGRALSRRQQ